MYARLLGAEHEIGRERLGTESLMWRSSSAAVALVVTMCWAVGGGLGGCARAQESPRIATAKGQIERVEVSGKDASTGTKPLVRVLGIERGMKARGDSESAGVAIGTKEGTITLWITLREPVEGQCVRVVRVKGKVPSGLELPVEGVQLKRTSADPITDGFVVLRWHDVNAQRLEGFAFWITVAAVNRSGIQTAWSDTIRVAHDGRSAVYD